MKKSLIIFCCLVASIYLYATNDNIGIIPAPAEVVLPGGQSLQLPSVILYHTNLDRRKNSELDTWMQKMNSRIEPFSFRKNTNKTSSLLNLELSGDCKPESYELVVEDGKILVKASDKAGIFYALQSLGQLIVHYSGNLPNLRIKDYPRFQYRGILLDPARNFLPVDFVKKQLDMMSYFKLNVLHWHLTEDAGWRIEIKKYPELTNNAAYYPYLNHEEWWLGEKKFCSKDEVKANGGYYTQEEIKDIVNYAKNLNITIVPEIDIPAHSAALLYSFPELRCEHSSANILCPGNQNMYKIMCEIFDEVLELFPSKLIHIGGDEVDKSIWKKCKHCQALMQEKEYNEVEELQSHMMNYFNDYFVKKGRRMIGWNEILHNNLSNEAVVMSWTGIEGGMNAAKQGKNAIMCPERYCYLDGFQDALPYLEISSGWYLPLEHVYSYNPAPPSLGKDIKDKILGVQGCLWGEWLYPINKVEKYLWPRAMAIAEVGWSQDEKKSYSNFYSNAIESVEFMRRLGYKTFDLKNEIGERKGYHEKLSVLSTSKNICGYEKDKYYSLLTDGKIGSWRLDSNSWFLSSGNQDLIVDLEKIRNINSVKFSTIQARGYRIPDKVEIYLSDDNVDYRLIYSSKNTYSYLPISYFYNRYIDNSWYGNTAARYVKVSVYSDYNWGIDEIIVE